MRKFILLVLLTVSCLSASAQSYDELWDEAEKERGFKPQSYIATMEKIKAKAEREGNMPQLLKADFDIASCRVLLSPEVVNDVLEYMKKEELKWREKDGVTSAFYCVFLHQSIIGDTVFSRQALANPDLLASKKASDYEPLVNILRKADNVSGSDDLLYLIGNAVGKTCFLNDYYTRKGNRRAALLTALDILDESTSAPRSVTAGNASETTQGRHASLSTYEILDSLQNLYGDLSIAPEIDIRRCIKMRSDKKYSVKETYDVILETVNRNATYPRMDVLRNILSAITVPSVYCKLDKSLFSSRDSIELNMEYVNVKEVKITLYKIDESLNVKTLESDYDFDNITKGQIAAENVFTLPSLEPYLRGKTKLCMPPLPLGGYVLEIMADTLKAFKIPVRVSDLRLIMMSYPHDVARIMAVDANSGRPVSGVSLIAFEDDVQTQVAVTDSKGEAKVEYKMQSPIMPQTTTDRWSTLCHMYIFTEAERDNDQKLLVLTDRDIYRPGQEVNVTALIYRNFEYPNAKAIKREKVVFTVEDTNGKEIFKTNGMTDEYGCCSVKFTIPKSGTTGKYDICVETEEEEEYKSFSVEEYKRPTFIVSLDEESAPYVLGDTIHLSGKAETLMGSPVQDATVVLELGCSSMSSESKVCKNDTLITVVTDVKGCFNAVVTPAIYSKESDDKSPIYINVTAKVTDRAGETHSQRYYQMTLSEKPVRMMCNIFYDNVYERKSIGNLKLWSVNGNKVVQSLPITYWFEGYEKYSVTKQGNKKVSVEIPAEVPDGKYWLYATCMGDTLKREVIVFDIANKRPCYDTRSWFYATSAVLDPTGKTPVTIQVGSSDADVSVAYAIFSGNKVLEEGRFDMTDSIVSRDIYYQKRYGDGILVAVMWYRDGKLYEHNFRITKKKDDYHLKMKWDTFRDRLQPGQTEQWMLNVTKPDGTAARANVFATMYDAALDLIESHWWPDYLENNSHDVPNISVISSEMLVGENMFSYASPLVRLPEHFLHGTALMVNSVRPYVYGKVIDINKEPVIGATVMSMDEKVGTFTDIDGNFKIDIPVGTPFMVKFIGCATWTGISTPNNMLIRLDNDGVPIDEVVVSAYAIATNKSFKGSEVRAWGSSSIVADGVYGCYSNDEIESALYGAAAGIAISNLVSFEPTKSAPDKTASTDFSAVPVRENLNELAFCYPNLRTDDRGNVAIGFTMPESLTKWQLKMFAHTKDLYVGNMDCSIVAAKDFMLQPNMPRFLRVGDDAHLSARILNISDRNVKGTARLVLIDPETEREVYTEDVEFDAAAEQTVVATFHYAPQADDPTLLICKMMATDGISSDGEQHYLPLLSRRELVMRTRPFTMYGSGKKTIDIASLLSPSSLDASLSIEYTNNPSMLMLQSLHAYTTPFDDCILCQSGALFVNSFGKRLVTENPALTDSLVAWNKADNEADTPTGNLQRNEQLLNIVLQETPWAMAAKNETEQKRRLAEFLNVRSLTKKIDKDMERIADRQNEDGSWGWFPGMNGSETITLLTLDALVNAQMVGLTDNKIKMNTMQTKAFAYLASAMEEHVKALKKEERQVPSRFMVEYLYLCAKAKPQLTQQQNEDKDYLVSLLDGCFRHGSIYERALCAIIFHDMGKDSLARDYAESVKQYSISDPERGRYFDTGKALYSWRSYKIPTQTKAIEALALITPDDRETIGEMQRWLLQEKRTQMWESSIAAVDAVNAFITGRENAFGLGGSPASITVDGDPLPMEGVTRVEGYVKVTMPAEGKRQVVIDKPSDGTSWGAVYAQMICDVDDVESSGSDITVKREILKDGKPADHLRLGDRVTVRITVKAVRDFDFVQVSDRRPACLEPVMQTSGYDYTLRCYVSSRDTRTDYFIAQMPRGEWVIEKMFYVDRVGTYRSGTITAQCAYSPEYTGTGKAVTVVVDE